MENTTEKEKPTIELSTDLSESGPDGEKRGRVWASKGLVEEVIWEGPWNEISDKLGFLKENPSAAESLFNERQEERRRRYKKRARL